MKILQFKCDHFYYYHKICKFIIWIWCHLYLGFEA